MNLYQESQQELAINMKKQKAPYSFFIIFILLSVIFSFSCQKNEDTHKSDKKVILTGWLTENQLFDKIPAYEQGKKEYQPDSTSIEYLKKFDLDINILVFLGTWCSDCKREVPRFLKIMELAQNDNIKFQLMGLDRSKRDSLGLAEKNQIEFVPTLVVFKNDQEVDRIVETPSLSIEQDLVEIFMMLE